MEGFNELLIDVVKQNASDLHLTVGSAPIMRKNGKLIRMGNDLLTQKDMEIYTQGFLSEEQFGELMQIGEIDLSFSIEKLGRFRVNVYKQRGTLSIAARIVGFEIPKISELGLPDELTELSKLTKGLILVTGPTGSGKSTTLASFIDKINAERDCHILTLEDPIEYLHRHKTSFVNQREIGSDSRTFASALRSALREDPDVILVGEMRDVETMAIAITAAETGHLVLSTLHTIGASNTIDRIIDVFPSYNQQQIRVQLAAVLQAVISQQLIPRADKPGRAVAVEIMITSPAVKNLIREGKTHQIDGMIQMGGQLGMQAMDSSLVNLYHKGVISYESAISRSISQESFMRMVKL